jgi:hypothetical protein
MLTNPTSKDFDAGRAVREERIGAMRIVIGLAELFGTVEGGT